MPDTFCPLRGDTCNEQCEWISDAGFCVAHHIATNMERIADALERFQIELDSVEDSLTEEVLLQ